MAEIRLLPENGFLSASNTPVAEEIQITVEVDEYIGGTSGITNEITFD